MARRKLVTALLVFLVAGQAISAQRGGRPAGAGGQEAPAAAPEVPIIGLAGIGFRVSDLTKARGYYQGVLGFAEAFSTKDQSGRVASVYFKINDDQYVEVVSDLKPGELPDRGRRARARAGFEEPSEQDEDQDCGRRLEVHRRAPVMRGSAHGHPCRVERRDDRVEIRGACAQRDEHVHVGGAVPNGA